MTSLNAHPIPHISTANDPIHSPTDLQQRWRALMGPLGFGERLVWMAVIGPDNRFTKALTQVEIDCPPDEQVANNLVWAMGEAIGEVADVRMAALLTRPGSGGISDTDRAWARLLTDAAARHRVRFEPVFRAHDEMLVEVPTC
ncbi:MAG TPA: hypothetical protein VIW24_06275 [Aldersonia sp.]